MSSITIPGAAGPITVTVTGAQTQAFAQSFATLVHSTSKFIDLSTGVTTTIAGSGKILYVDTTAGGSVTIPAAGGPPSPLFVSVNGAASVQGSGKGDSVLATGTGAHITYTDLGGNNGIGFVAGNDVYIGDTAAGAGRDTIVNGAGFDSIYTGIGAALVESGTGNAFVGLNDTAASTGDTVYLESGRTFVDAAGVNDKILIGASGQFVLAGIDTAAAVAVVIAAGAGDNTISGAVGNMGGATVSIYDAAGGNSFNGGAGSMYFVAQGAITDTFSGGSGALSLFGAAGSDLTLSTQTMASGHFQAGAGSETLNGAGSHGNLGLVANNDTDTASAVAHTVLVGGAGNDYIESGDGNATLTGGGGQNEFVIQAPNDSIAAHVLISDFGSGRNDVVGFSGYTPQQIQAALQSMETVSGSFGKGVEIHFADGTTIIFAGVNTLNGHVV